MSLFLLELHKEPQTNIKKSELVPIDSPSSGFPLGKLKIIFSKSQYFEAWNMYHLQLIYRLKKVIFSSHLKLPKGTIILWRCLVDSSWDIPSGRLA